MAKTKIVIALVALAAVALVAVGVASAQIAATQTPNQTTGAVPNSFWGYMGRCFQFWANQPTNQPTGAPITQAIPPQVYSTTTPAPAAPYSYGFNGGCMGRYW
jgi:hypothetical protein